MAVAHSSDSESHTGTTGSTNQTSFSWTHTQTGTPQGVLVFVHTRNVANYISSVTYGGTTLTRVAGAVAIDTAGEPGRTDLFFLGAGLSSGNQTITVNRTNNSAIMYASAATVAAGADVNVTGIQILEENQSLTQLAIDDGSSGIDSLRYAAAYFGGNSPANAGADSTQLTSIDLGSFGNSMVVENTAGQGARNVGFQGGSDDLAAVFVAVREVTAWSTTGETGSFTLTGNDATLTVTAIKAIAADLGTFTLTGNPADFARQYSITIDAGGFTLTGNSADLRHNSRIDGGTGSFSLTGNSATFSLGYSIAATKGTFSLTGNPATLSKNNRLEATTGTFTETGQAAGLQYGRLLAGDFAKFFLPERNMRLWSESFDNAAWAKVQSSITANATTAPDGTLTADALIENTTPSTAHFVVQSITYVTGRTYTASCYFKLYPGPITRYARLQLGSATVFGTDTYININLTAGTFTAPAGSPSDSGITNVGNGWYRAWLTKQYTGTGITTGPSIAIISTGNTALYTDADGLSGIYIWGSQFEEGSVSDYDPTGAASATRTTFSLGYSLAATKGTFSLAGNAATLSKNNRLEATTGTFALTGGAATLRQGLNLPVNAGTFNFTGNPVTFARNWNILADRGQFTFTGKPAALTKVGAFEIDVLAGAFALTGNTAALKKSSSLQAVRGLYTFTGQPVTFAKTSKLLASPGTFNFTGNPVTFGRNWNILADQGQFTFTGQPVTFAKTRKLLASPGTFSLIGNSVTLSEVTNYSLSVDKGSFALTGNSIILSKTYNLSVEKNAFVFTGNPVTLLKNTDFAAEAGIFALSGKTIAFARTYQSASELGSFTLTGLDVNLVKSGSSRRRNVLIF